MLFRKADTSPGLTSLPLWCTFLMCSIRLAFVMPHSNFSMSMVMRTLIM